MKLTLKWIVLIALILMGLVSAGKLTYFQYLSGDACPLLGKVPACYVAFGGYFFIALSIIMKLLKSTKRGIMDKLFYLSIGIAGGLALFASVMELIIGGICPIAFGWLPMCYPSLLFSIIILLLYRNVTKISSVKG